MSGKPVIDKPAERPENLPPVRLCNICGFPLPRSPYETETQIGIHVWCLQERRLTERKRIKRPNYGTEPTGT
jgi:hypothetical protein